MEKENSKLEEYANEVMKTISKLPKEEQRRVGYRINWRVKQLFAVQKVKKNKSEKKSKK